MAFPALSEKLLVVERGHLHVTKKEDTRREGRHCRDRGAHLSVPKLDDNKDVIQHITSV